MLVLPLVGREIPVIADEYVDKEFGTGCVKITPAHDPNDFEVGQRHNLAQIKVMNDDATMNSYAGKYEGMDRYECRKAMIKDLEDEGLLVKVEDHSHNVGQCYRCGTTVEPIVSKQWFVKMKPLAQPAIDAVKNGDTQFVPEHFERCISTGLKIFVIGVFHVSFGGDTEYLLSIVTIAAKLLLQKRTAQFALSAARKCVKTPILLILGSHRHYGRSQHLAGLIRQKNLITSIRQACL